MEGCRNWKRINEGADMSAENTTCTSTRIHAYSSSGCLYCRSRRNFIGEKKENR